jgi:Cu-processing system permease protein
MIPMTPLHTARKVAKFELGDLVRSRWLLAYFLFLAIGTDALLRFTGADQRALLSLMNLMLLVVPLVAVAFGTVHLYNRRDFMELLLAQPVGRREAFAGLYLGLALPLAGSLAVGLAVPAALHGAWSASLRTTLVTLIAMGATLTAIFTAIAFGIAIRCEDRVRGFAIALAVWLAFAVLYDGLVLVVASIFADSSLERPLLAAMIANPVDLARVVLLLQFDISALMGYTGAVFQKAFGSLRGLTVATAALALWIAVPVWLGSRAFVRKDF